MRRNEYKALLEIAQIDLLLTAAFFVFQSSVIFIVIVPVKGTIMKIKKVQNDDRYNMKNKS